MDTVNTVDELRIRTAGWRRAGARIALVPTMGNLHQGHLDLVRRARQRAQRVVVSIFVNPLQFGPSEDFAAYPRTLTTDAERLEREAVDLVFAPSVEEVYPKGQGAQTRVEVPGISDILCGAKRPGHFVGVATVVCKLFNMVQPDLAVFGEKDFQQLMVIRRMTADLSMPVEIVGAVTVREADGLALSSRNGYLSAAERARASGLYKSLKQAAEALQRGYPVAEVERRALSDLSREGFVPDYFSVRRAGDLQLAGPEERELVILAAAYLGNARLIDNLRVSL
jgi:pantoate--beta-alanine ligase